MVPYSVCVRICLGHATHAQVVKEVLGVKKGGVLKKDEKDSEVACCTLCGVEGEEWNRWTSEGLDSY